LCGPVPGGLTGPSYHCGTWIHRPGLPDWGMLCTNTLLRNPKKWELDDLIQDI
jgi:hypothetical protein